MFSLPSVWNLVISTIVFIAAAWYLRRYLDAQGIPHSAVRGLLVFVLAYIVSWGSGEATDWVQLKLEGPTKSEQPAPPNITELMQQLEQLKQK
jgi:hypothetical protein